MKMSKDKKSILEFFKNRLPSVKKKPSQLSLPLTHKTTKTSEITKPSSLPPLRKKGNWRFYHVIQFLPPSLSIEGAALFPDLPKDGNRPYQIFNKKPWRAGEVLEFLSDNRYPNPDRSDLCKLCNRLTPIQYLPETFDKRRQPFFLYLVDHLCLEGFEEGLAKDNPCHITVYRPANSSKKQPLKKLVEIHQELKNTYVFLSRKHFLQFFSITPEEFQQFHEKPVSVCLNGMYLYKFQRHNETYYFSVIQPDLTSYLTHTQRRFRENITI